MKGLRLVLQELAEWRWAAVTVKCSDNDSADSRCSVGGVSRWLCSCGGREDSLGSEGNSEGNTKVEAVGVIGAR